MRVDADDDMAAVCWMCDLKILRIYQPSSIRRD